MFAWENPSPSHGNEPWKRSMTPPNAPFSGPRIANMIIADDFSLPPPQKMKRNDHAEERVLSEQFSASQYSCSSEFGEFSVDQYSSSQNFMQSPKLYPLNFGSTNGIGVPALSTKPVPPFTNLSDLDPIVDEDDSPTIFQMIARRQQP